MLPAATRRGVRLACPNSIGVPMIVRKENERPGTRDWLLTKTRVDPATKYRCPWIEGYCSRTSVRRRARRSRSSSAPTRRRRSPSTSTGWAITAGTRRAAHASRLGPFAGEAPARPAGRGEAAARVPLGAVPTLTDPRRLAQRRLPRQAHGRARGACRATSSSSSATTARRTSSSSVSDNTWQAYNRWPEPVLALRRRQEGSGTGARASRRQLRPALRQVLPDPRRTRCRSGSGEFLLWEFPLAYWMEQQGYDVTYISNLDTHADPARPARAQGVPVGRPRRVLVARDVRTMKAAVDDGLNVAFLSGNTCCGVIDSTPRRDGRAEPDHRAGRPVRRASTEETRTASPRKPTARKNGPNEATLIGARSTVSRHRRRRLDLPQAGPLALRRHRDEGRRRHPRPGRLGVARRPGDDPGPGGRRQRHDHRRPRGATGTTRRRSTPARRATSSSTRRRSGGPTG